MSRKRTTVALLAGLALAWISAAPADAGVKEDLDQAVKKIDKDLYEQSVADIRAWLDKRIEASGEFGVYSFGWSHLRIRGDVADLDLNRGGFADSAAQFLRAYEMLGGKKYLEAGLKTADFFLAVQEPAGHFPTGATVHRDGKIVAGGGKHAEPIVRMEDGYQFRPFCLLLYAWQLTGEKKYLDGAKRCGELITQRVMHPRWGYCPDIFDTRIEGDVTKQPDRHGDFGVQGGGSLSDYCTTDGFRMSVILYHLTKDKKYLARASGVGEWLIETQLGKGKVRGWGDNYNSKNQPVPSRNFEGVQIDPRNWNRFAGPLLVWFYAITGDQKYRTLFEESVDWMLSVKQPGGWAFEYTPDGRPCATLDHKLFLYSEPEEWPGGSKPGYIHDKVQMVDSVMIRDLLKSGGRDALRERFRGPGKYSDEQYLAARLAAAKRCTDENFQVKLQPLDLGDMSWIADGKYVMGKYQERVRLRPANPDAELPAKDAAGRVDLTRQSWKSPHAGYNIVPYGWAQWQYVWDANLAMGRIDADAAARGGIGLESERFVDPWDMMWHWESRLLDVEDWCDVPLGAAK